MAIADGLEFGRADCYGSAGVEVRLQRDVSVIVLVGEVDLAMQRELELACDQALEGGVPVIVDASATTFIDSVALGFLVRLIRADPGGRRPQLTGASPLVLDTVNILGLAQLMDLA